MYTIWYGSEKSFNAVIEAELKVQTMLKSSPKSMDLELPPLLEVVGDVGIIPITGSLTYGSAGWMRLFGVTGYDDIMNAAVDAVKNKGVESIVFKIDSPGGSARGVRQASDLIKNVGKVKPVSAYADSIGSAAYWLGTAAGHITLDEMGLAGSIGALIVHSEYSKQLEQEGVKTTIIRAGKNKALANPIEPLSEEAQASLQEIVDMSRDLFTNAVAENLGVSSSTVENNMGQGKEFMGAKAVAVGLVNRVGTFEDALAYSKASRTGFKAVKAVK